MTYSELLVQENKETAHSKANVRSALAVSKKTSSSGASLAYFAAKTDFESNIPFLFAFADDAIPVAPSGPIWPTQCLRENRETEEGGEKKQRLIHSCSE